jgi:hypothetical protein
MQHITSAYVLYPNIPAISFLSDSIFDITGSLLASPLLARVMNARYTLSRKLFGAPKYIVYMQCIHIVSSAHCAITAMPWSAYAYQLSI